jgi:hypothetical protein
MLGMMLLDTSQSLRAKAYVHQPNFCADREGYRVVSINRHSCEQKGWMTGGEYTELCWTGMHNRSRESRLQGRSSAVQ